MKINLQRIENYLYEHYDINSIKLVKYLGESENLPFRVETTGGKKYLFKCHTNSNSKIMVQSELLWLEDLHMNSSLQVQTPVKNNKDELVTTIFDEETKKETYWALQVWVDGELLDEPSEEEVKKLAEIFVELHNHSSNWQVPECFERPTKNDESLLNSFQQLKERLPLQPQEAEVLEKTIKKS